MPAPMMAPTPSAVSCHGPSTRRRRFSLFISSRRSARGFLENIEWVMGSFAQGVVGPRPAVSIPDRARERTGRTEELRRSAGRPSPARTPPPGSLASPQLAHAETRELGPGLGGDDEA